MDISLCVQQRLGKTEICMVSWENGAHYWLGQIILEDIDFCKKYCWFWEIVLGELPCESPCGPLSIYQFDFHGWLSKQKRAKGWLGQTQLEYKTLKRKNTKENYFRVVHWTMLRGKNFIKFHTFCHEMIAMGKYIWCKLKETQTCVTLCAVQAQAE